jgi:hypothetical protein
MGCTIIHGPVDRAQLPRYTRRKWSQRDDSRLIFLAFALSR